MGVIEHARSFAAIGSIAVIVLGVVCALKAAKTGQQGLLFSLYLTIALVASPYAHFHDATILLLPMYLLIEAMHSGSIRGSQGILSVICCCWLYVWPAFLLAVGGHYVWNSRVYLMFPVILCFIAAIAANLRKKVAVGFDG